jgi:hypothetical protein
VTPQFTFLVSTDGNGRTKDSRKKVRSHVMHNFRKNQVLERVEASSSRSDLNIHLTPGSEPEKRTQRRRSKTPELICINCGRVNGNSVLSGISESQGSIPCLNRSSGEHMDLFNALPVSITKGTYLLFNHSKHDFHGFLFV